MWYPEERQFLLGIYNIGDTIRPFPETDLPIGANFAVLRSVLEELGGFDSRVGFDNSRKSHGKLGSLNALPEATVKAMERLDQLAQEEQPVEE